MPTRALLLGLSAAAANPAIAEDVNFGEAVLFDFDALLPETRYGWSSGDALITNIDFDKQIGGIVGSPDQQVTPPLVVGGTTIVPEVRADTRSGLRLTTSYQGRAGVELRAGVTTGGEGFSAAIQAGPTLSLDGPSVAGQFVQPRSNTVLGSQTTFDPGLPRLDAGMNAVLAGDFQNKIEYGAFPLADYEVGEFGLDFDFDLNLFDFDLDLNLPDLPTLSFPGLPEFTIPDLSNDDDATAFRQQLPPPPDPTDDSPKPPNFISVGEIAIDNPFRTISSESQIEDGVASFSAGGSLLRTGLDIDGIASALVTGGFSFTGTGVSVGPAKFSYDLIDVKYGLELGVQYDTELETALNVEMDFDREVLIRDAQGNEVTTDSFVGRWDELPEIALLDREDVEVTVDFTDIEAFFSQKAELTLSDYMELQALRLKAKVAAVGPEAGPLIYKKFPLAGELAAFEVFGTEPQSLGSLELIDGLWDGAFTLQAAEVKEVYLNASADKLHDASDWTAIDTGTAPTTLSDKTLVIGQAGAGPVNSRLDLQPVSYLDPGIEKTLTWGVLDGFISIQNFSADVSDITQRTTIDGLVVLPGASYEVDEQSARLWGLNYIENDGQITANGHLDFEANNSILDIQGDGEIALNSYSTLTADRLRHGEGHTLTFNSGIGSRVNFGIDGLDRFDNLVQISDFAYWYLIRDGTPVASEHTFAVDKLDNAGTIAANNTLVDLAASDIQNRTTGVLEATAGGVFTLNGTGDSSDDTFANAGVIRASGNNPFGRESTINIDSRFVESREDATTGEITGVGHIYAENSGVIRFTDDFSVGFSNQHIEAKDGGLVRFDSLAQAVSNTKLTTQVGGTMTFSEGLELIIEDELEIVNHGTLNFDGGSSTLIATVSGPDTGGGGTIRPLGLENTGTINVRNASRFIFGVAIDDFADDGATLVGGTWNVLGESGSFSNLTSISPGIGSVIDARVLEVVPDDQFLGEVFDLSVADTSLKTNAADVTLQGRALFPYFNTVQTNRGTINITQGHEFTTAGTLTNDGGTINVESSGDLLVQGALIVDGGSVNIGTGSNITLQTITQTLIDEDTLQEVDQQKTLEVVGGAFRYADPSALGDSTPMFSRESSSGPAAVSLNSGQFWAVHEKITIDDQGNEVVNPATIDLNGAQIIENNGSITIDGAAASFQAAEFIEQNTGTLSLHNGVGFASRAATFNNTGEVLMRGASLTMQADAPTLFRNDGTLAMDGDSYLKADQFVNTADATFHLDGVLDAPLVTIESGTTFRGSGFITGAIENQGTLDIGNSPGSIETFSGFTQSDDGRIIFEVQGLEAGVDFDQLVVTTPDVPDAPDSFVLLNGTIQIVFDPELVAPNHEWVLIDTQDPDASTLRTFDFIQAEGLTESLLALDDYSELMKDENDVLLGELAGNGVFLTYAGGDGDDVSVYAVPEPGSLVLLGLGGLALSGRRRRSSPAHRTA